MIDLLSAFPAGAAGVALLLLRVSAALLLLAAPVAFGAFPVWAWIGPGLVGAALVFGFLARIGAAIVALVAAIAATVAAESLCWLFALHAIDAFALALLGPGAYSIDARVYGRRVITLDP